MIYAATSSAPTYPHRAQLRRTFCLTLSTAALWLIACGEPTELDTPGGLALSAKAATATGRSNRPPPSNPANSNLIAALSLANETSFPDPTGSFASTSLSGTVDLTGPFFQDLGTNGRACVSCHDPADGWTITPGRVRSRFDATSGTDPIFRTVDGSVSPKADVSNVTARRSAYAMLLSKALIRIGLPIPANAEFNLVSAEDPYDFASTGELSLFRRPLPTTNVSFLSTVMWDGRETFRDANSKDCIAGTTTCFAALRTDLLDQANLATIGHAQGAVALTAAQRAGIVDFELALFTAQTTDSRAGNLNAAGAHGGTAALIGETFYFGINDPISGDYRSNAPFNPVVFNLYNAWKDAPGGGTQAFRASIARGQTLFNKKPIMITGVKGLNDDLNVAAIPGTCTTCHDSPNAGNHSIPAPLDIGLTDASRRTADLPLYTLRRISTGETIQTTDPGRALITGKWRDIGRFKGPVLRALAARAPYFHNGFASDLGAVIDFYNTRFSIGLTSQDKTDLVAFLNQL